MYLKAIYLECAHSWACILISFRFISLALLFFIAACTGTRTWRKIATFAQIFRTDCGIYMYIYIYTYICAYITIRQEPAQHMAKIRPDDDDRIGMQTSAETKLANKNKNRRKNN